MRLLLPVAALLLCLVVPSPASAQLEEMYWNSCQNRRHPPVTAEQSLAACNVLIDSHRRAPWKWPFAYTSRGVVQLRRNDLQAALADFNEAIRLNDHFSWAYMNRA